MTVKSAENFFDELSFYCIHRYAVNWLFRAGRKGGGRIMCACLWMSALSASFYSMLASCACRCIHYTLMLRLNGQNRLPYTPLWKTLVTIALIEKESHDTNASQTAGQPAADGPSSQFSTPLSLTILSLLHATIDIIFTPLCFFILCI